MNNYYLSNDFTDCIGFHDYIKKIFAFKTLTEEEEYEAANNWLKTGDKKSAQLLVTSHLKLVVKMAMLYKYKGCDLPVIDLISEGTIGLIEAVKKFDLEKKCRFATYAIFHVKAKMHSFIMNSFSLVKLGTGLVTKKLFSKYKQIVSSVSNNDIEKIANEVGTSIKNVNEIKSRLHMRDCSLNALISIDSNVEMGDSIPCTQWNPENIVMTYNDKNKQYSAMAYACAHFLDAQEKDIIANRILREEPLKLRELAEKYGVSNERIRQKQEIALKKIRDHMKKERLMVEDKS